MLQNNRRKQKQQDTSLYHTATMF